MIKLITFDLDETLWPIHQVITHASQVFQKWLDQYYPVISENFSNEALFDLRKKLIYERPELAGDLTQLRKDTICQAAIESGINQTEALALSEQAFKVFFDERNKVTLFPGAIDMLETLSNDYNLVAISNGNADLDVIGIKQYFAAHLKAGKGTPAKPHPQMFEQALAFANAKPTETIHIGDDFECDIQAANQLGIKTLYADLMKHQNPKCLALADGSFQSLNEIAACIKEIAING